MNINVTDVNDNPPHFLYTPYEFELNSINATEIGRVTAIDDDLGSGGIVKFRLMEQTEVSGSSRGNSYRRAQTSLIY